MVQSLLELCSRTFVRKNKINLDEINLFFEKNAFVDVNQIDSNGKNSLMILCENQNENLEIFKFLLEKGININQINNSGLTLISYVRKMETIKFLIENGLDFSLLNYDGETFLETLNSIHDVIKYVEQGVNINVLNSDNETIFDKYYEHNYA